MEKTKQIVLLALMISIALVLSIVETWIPVPAPVPGVKLGLANIVTMMVIVFFGYRDALLVVIIRCILASLYTGGLTVFFFSVAGGILSATVMAYIYKNFSKLFSLLGVSICGAVFHNIGQIIVACIILRDMAVLSYFPVLLLTGIITGCLIGVASSYLAESLRKIGLMKR